MSTEPCGGTPGGELPGAGGPHWLCRGFRRTGGYREPARNGLGIAGSRGPRGDATDGRGRSTRSSPQFRREGGYVTLFVLAIAAAIFLALGSAMQANSCLRAANRRQAQQLQARAAEIPVRP